MEKLTAEVARRDISHLKAFQKQPNIGLSLREENYLQALEIALPILEQQDHEKSIIAGQLEAVRDSLSLNPHQDAIISCAIDRLNVLTLRTLELSRSLIKQQERGEGWIEWAGGECPVAPWETVSVKHRNDKCTSPDGPAYQFDWSNYPSKFDTDIIAYRVVNP